MIRSAIACASIAPLFFAATIAQAEPLKIGSKRFTESYILAEIAKESVARAHLEAKHIEGLGGSAIAFRALESGAIDLYPDYTGTLAETVLHDVAPNAVTLEEIKRALASRGLAITSPLGFEDKYALGMREATSEAMHVTRISDLARAPAIRLGLSHEFLGRADGWPGLAKAYGLEALETRAMDHGLAYRAVEDGTVDVIDVYTTDAKIAKLHLRLLDDDRAAFPSYAACFVYREASRAKMPEAFAAIDRLAGTIDVDAMRRMNGDAESGEHTFAEVARNFVTRGPARANASIARESFVRGLVRSSLRYGPRHVALVFAAVLAAVLVGIPLGVFARKRRIAGGLILGVTSVVQTIPSLALLAMCIPIFGIGPVPALVALFVYALLPILRNTVTALQEIPTSLRESAEGLGLSAFERLRIVELPLASRSILAGIKTSVVWTVGTATVAAFIGAGGLGEPISIGLNLNDMNLILDGAIPAALLAIVLQFAFVVIDRFVVPRGLRIASLNEPE